MVTRSHYRKVRTRRITAQSDDADVWRVSLCQGCADNCSPVAVKSDETLSCEGETNPPSPLYRCRRCPDIGGYRQSVGALRVMGFPISPAVSPHWSGR